MNNVSIQPGNSYQRAQRVSLSIAMLLCATLLHPSSTSGCSSKKAATTSLIAAIHSGSEDDVHKSLQDGADLKAGGETWTPLFVSIFNGKEAIAEILLTAGADPSSPPNALNHAARTGMMATVKALIKAGVRINLEDKEAWSAMAYAGLYNQAAVIALLKQYGAHTPTLETLRDLYWHIQNKYHNPINIAPVPSPPNLLEPTRAYRLLTQSAP